MTTKRYPSKSAILKAIAKGPYNILETNLDGYQYEVNKRKQPYYMSGGFAMVFKFHQNNKKYKAFKIWSQDVPDLKERLTHISNFINSNQLPYFVQYSFNEEGIKIYDEDENTENMWPTLTMDWIEGKDLKTYIGNVISEANGDNKINNTLLELSKKLLECFKTLHSHKVSHGDLQHDNILIDVDGNVKLIDYDCMYVPTMPTDTKQSTAGYAGYQHPKRMQSSDLLSSEKTDYFSEKIIYAGVLMLAKYPELWEEAKVEKNEYGLLFNACDFENFTESDLYRKGAKDFEIKSVLNQINADLQKTNIEDICPLKPIPIIDPARYIRKEDKGKEIDSALQEFIDRRKPQPKPSIAENYIQQDIDLSKYKRKTT